MSKSIPTGFHTLTPHIVVADGMAAIDFYKNAFGAQENTRLMTPDGKSVMHAQLTIGDSVLMLASEFPPNIRSPKSRGGTSVFLHLYLADADAAFDRPIQAGCTVRMPVADTFWGDRYGMVEDPFGHQWSLATHRHDYTPEQIAANVREFMARMPKS
jgi:uncharacterized glyoxalase superfamily protein PhnB